MLTPLDVLRQGSRNPRPPTTRNLAARCRYIVLLLLLFSAHPAVAGMISVGGSITQSTPDGTGPAANNPSLNNIVDLQDYLVTMTFSDAINGPGTYDLTGSTLIFSVPAAPATESDFAGISLTIIPNGTDFDFSLLACLTTGTDCLLGNQLDLNFRIPAANLFSFNVAAIGLDPPHPLDLLEDDGTTDIHGSITTYAFVPEPPSLLLVGAGLALTGTCLRRFRRSN
jgi:hypothetical protein